MPDNTNIGYAFPLEKLGSDIARNGYNYQSILNGLIEWNNTTDDTVNIRLTKDSDPWYEDYVIPSKKSLLDVGTYKCNVTGIVQPSMFVTDCSIDVGLYGGSKTFTTTNFNASTDVSIDPSNEITLADGSFLTIGDRIKFSTELGGTLPTPLVETMAYYIYDKPSANVIKLTTDTDTNLMVSITGTGTGDIVLYKYVEPMAVDDTDPGDTAIIRTTVDNNGDTQWNIYYEPVISEWIGGSTYQANNIVTYGNTYYRVLFDTSGSYIIPQNDTSNYKQLIRSWIAGHKYYAGDLVINPNNDIYIVLNTTTTTTQPSSNSTDFSFIAKQWTTNTDYLKGSYIYDTGVTYLATSDIMNSTTSPTYGGDSDKWEQTLLLKTPSTNTFSSTSVYRWILPLNVSKFRLRNTGTIASTDHTDITVRVTGKTKEPASIYQRSVENFPSSNFSFWPHDMNTIWKNTNVYGPTNEAISITKRQDYSATMIFDHTRPDVAKTVNFINYDGPDLDQGLCIYLPVEIDVGDDGIAYPEDGYTFEFFFRIWPNTALNDEMTRDHIVNKAHIYVYNAQDLNAISNDICEEPIAKFSMARSSTFYMFGENVTVPDKPVCYRATFVYNDADKKWCTMDYYQLPDHIFVGPVGFIDPQNPANMDINMETIGNINPNAANIGYETAAFPLFQDPFSNPDLSPYRVSGNNADEFKNRII